MKLPNDVGDPYAVLPRPCCCNLPQPFYIPSIPKEKKVVEYDVTIGQTAERLALSVNEAIKQGYQPFGNVYKDQDNWFVQTMVKYG